jgi:hypothetical protein
MRVRRTRRAVRKHGQQQNERGKSREKKPHVTSMKKKPPEGGLSGDIFTCAVAFSDGNRFPLFPKML